MSGRTGPSGRGGTAGPGGPVAGPLLSQWPFLGVLSRWPFLRVGLGCFLRLGLVEGNGVPGLGRATLPGTLQVAALLRRRLAVGGAAGPALGSAHTCLPAWPGSPMALPHERASVDRRAATGACWSVIRRYGPFRVHAPSSGGPKRRHSRVKPASRAPTPGRDQPVKRCGSLGRADSEWAYRRLRHRRSRTVTEPSFGPEDLGPEDLGSPAGPRGGPCDRPFRWASHRPVRQGPGGGWRRGSVRRCRRLGHAEQAAGVAAGQLAPSGAVRLRCGIDRGHLGEYGRVGRPAGVAAVEQPPGSEGAGH